MEWQSMISRPEPHPTGRAGYGERADTGFSACCGRAVGATQRTCQAETSRGVASVRLTSVPGHLGERQWPNVSRFRRPWRPARIALDLGDQMRVLRDGTRLIGRAGYDLESLIECLCLEETRYHPNGGLPMIRTIEVRRLGKGRR